MSQFEQRENVKFCQKLSKTASETFHMIKQAYGEALGRSAVFISGTKVLLVHEELPKQEVIVLPHHPCSLDLAPCDFFFLFPLERKATWASISVGRRDRRCHKGSRMGPSCQYLSAVFPAAIPTLADLHSGQRRLF
jgi:hypothetical protein